MTPAGAGSRALTVWQVNESEAGKRLDKFLVDHIPELGRRGVKRLLTAGRVQVNGRASEKSRVLTLGAQVSVRLEQPEMQPDPLAPLSVLLERPDFLVLNKPAGQASVPRHSGETGTLAQALAARFPECRGLGGSWDGGLIHRLDTYTSGVLVAARNAESWQSLRGILTQGKLIKRYLAMVEGCVPGSGSVERALGPSSRSGRRVEVKSEASPLPIRKTDYTVLGVRNGHSLLEVEVSRAYRHQIRAHLASIGYPIVGDRVYGSGVHPALGERHALHASYAAFGGDTRILAFEARAELPPELVAFWDGLSSATSDSRVNSTSSKIS